MAWEHLQRTNSEDTTQTYPLCPGHFQGPDNAERQEEKNGISDEVEVYIRMIKRELVHDSVRLQRWRPVRTHRDGEEDVGDEGADEVANEDSNQTPAAGGEPDEDEDALVEDAERDLGELIG